MNCAGIGPSARVLGRKGVHELGLFRKVVETNLVGSFIVMAVAAEAIAATEPDAYGWRRLNPLGAARSCAAISP